MIASAFLCGPGDHVWLPHKLRVHSQFSDAIFVLTDRCPEAEPICRLFPKAQICAFDGHALPMRHDGVAFQEGLLRQALWDWCAASDPQWVVLADADEFPAPSIEPFLRAIPSGLDCFYADWVNLVFDATHAIGGTACPWSWQKPGTNKKGDDRAAREGA